jgi:hypothetical protein
VHNAYKDQEYDEHYGKDCADWMSIYSGIAWGIAGKPDNLVDTLKIITEILEILNVPEAPPCEECRTSLEDWQRSIEATINAIPKFSTLR